MSTSAPGRHRRTPPVARSVLFSVAAVVTLVLASAAAVTLTAPTTQHPQHAAPHGASAGTPSTAPATALPSAPATQAPRGTAPARSADTPRGQPPARRAPTATSAAPDPAPTDSSDTPGDPGGTDQRTQLEDEVTELTNQARADAGCEPVSTDERLRTAARGHSDDMATHDYFDHTGRDGSSPADRMSAAGYPRPGGENIAMGYPDPAAVTAGWMGSDGHRENMLNCGYTATGVGLARDGSGRPYWTQVFGY